MNATVTLPRETVERALRAISASIFGTDTYKVSSRGDFTSTVEKELRAALDSTVTEALAEPAPRRLTKEDIEHVAGGKVDYFDRHVFAGAIEARIFGDVK